ncbi:MAG: capsular biosynthesis protein [Silicimonas sp.]|nr:capsular biosynthesis protein [Silicimonas sp.]
MKDTFPSADLSDRHLLLLQGHPSSFWGQLADAARAQGAQVSKVHFCLADKVYWGGRSAISYRGGLADWPDWLKEHVKAEGITDILYYADRFPYHVKAREVADALGVSCWATEFGYLRPDWITFEPGGLGAFSSFDRHPDRITETALGRDLPDMNERFSHGFAAEAFHEVCFGLLTVLGRPLYPRFRSDRVFWPVFDYLSWLPKLATGPRDERAARRLQARLAAQGQSYFLLPMQIESDYQIRDNSPYNALEEFLNEVLGSFARHAPADDRLVIKLHPLDSGMENWARRLRRLARRHDLNGRIDVARGGHLGEFIRGSKGVVLVNSTVGLHALRQQVPVHPCGHAIYDVAGLTDQGPLDGFWTAPSPVDADLLDSFLRALTKIQIKGSFFHPEGRNLVIEGILARLREAGGDY